MQFRTVNNLDAFLCISAMQKSIRRGLERQAMEFAVEMIHTKKAFCTMVVNRLEVIAHEDVGLADINAVNFVLLSAPVANRAYDKEKFGKVRLVVGNMIRVLCKAAKSREGDHFQAAVGLSAEQDGFVPEVPDWAYCQHTRKGKQLGRGVDHFVEEGAKLVPEPIGRDKYKTEAVRRWKVKHGEGE
jgi:replication-associated recombination protein RarA